ncbi:HAMP domain-containing sensor histidine kinase [Curtobacterium sp. MCPF17_046]|uniref:sensor histidine kinase n=1 Tax=Curtobacterium sp. MCPF17_046 TaxID=2175663 RepID=UPI0021AC22AF|nr:HAMP domain-containing sensor histidine kinase [Curtobacterium sp. MCPF17_046]
MVDRSRPSRRPRSIRARATGGAALVVLVALVIGAVAFVGVLRTSLSDGVRSSAEQTLDGLATRVEADGAGAVTAEDDDVLAQLQDDDGRVLARAEDSPGRPLATDEESRYRHDGERWLLVADDVDLPDGTGGVLVVGAPLEDADAAVQTVTVLLVVAVPVVVALMSLVTWFVVGRALRPVDRMRREVDDVEGANLHARIDEPGSGDEVDRLAVTMNRMLGRLEASQQAQRRFVSDASHELRSPLATIRQHAEVARAHPEVTDTADLADVVLDEGARLQELVESLLLLTRLDERGRDRDRAVDLDDLVFAEASRPRASVHVDVSGVAPARVRGDDRLLGRVVRNLVDNAVRHADRAVTVALGSVAGDAVLTVDDDGRGIPEGDRTRVFERFVRLDEGRARDAGGSGLGLAIVDAVVRGHGGSVAVSAAPDGGARFTVRLPLLRD